MIRVNMSAEDTTVQQMALELCVALFRSGRDFGAFGESVFDYPKQGKRVAQMAIAAAQELAAPTNGENPLGKSK